MVELLHFSEGNQVPVLLSTFTIFASLSGLSHAVRPVGPSQVRQGVAEPDSRAIDSTSSMIRTYRSTDATAYMCKTPHTRVHTAHTQSRAATTTQARNPWRTVTRTVVQVLIPGIIAAGLVIPMVVQIVLDHPTRSARCRTPYPLPCRVSLSSPTAISGALAKIMAIPQVETFLQSHRVTSWLAAEPYEAKHRAPKATGPASLHSNDPHPDSSGVGVFLRPR